MKEIFNDYIKNSFGEYKQGEFKFHQFEQNYKIYFPENKNAKLLDIGIGRGEMLSCYKNWGYKNYLGIDISPDTIGFCKSLGLNCQLVDDSSAFLKENIEQYDLITLIDVLEHIPRENVISFLKDIRNSLVENGTLIIQVPNLQAPDGHLHMYNDITHFVGYIEHSLSQVLIASGFNKFHFQGFEELIGNSGKIKRHKFYRKIYWKVVRITRGINTNINPLILHPVFSAIVKKSKFFHG